MTLPLRQRIHLHHYFKKMMLNHEKNNIFLLTIDDYFAADRMQSKFAKDGAKRIENTSGKLALFDWLSSIVPGHNLLEWKDAGHFIPLQYPERLNELIERLMIGESE